MAVWWAVVEVDKQRLRWVPDGVTQSTHTAVLMDEKTHFQGMTWGEQVVWGSNPHAPIGWGALPGWYGRYHNRELARGWWALYLPHEYGISVGGIGRLVPGQPRCFRDTETAGGLR